MKVYFKQCGCDATELKCGEICPKHKEQVYEKSKDVRHERMICIKAEGHVGGELQIFTQYEYAETYRQAYDEYLAEF